MSPSVRILSVSDDDGLRFSRALLLANDGYEAESMTSGTALSLARVDGFEIAVICRSVEPERAMALAEMLRQGNPEISILTFSPQEGPGQCIDGGLEIASGPESVLEACRKLCDEIAARHGCCEQ
jgi:DNA-binding NtrC family response regulator